MDSDNPGKKFDMALFRFRLGLLLSIVTFAGCASSQPGPSRIWITDVTIISPENLTHIVEGDVLIENGRIGAAIKGATLVGNGPDVLTRVGMVGNDLKLDDGIGVCGKEGQSVPVGVGQPTMRIDGLTVGGTA